MARKCNTTYMRNILISKYSDIRISGNADFTEYVRRYVDWAISNSRGSVMITFRRFRRYVKRYHHENIPLALHYSFWREVRRYLEEIGANYREERKVKRRGRRKAVGQLRIFVYASNSP